LFGDKILNKMGDIHFFIRDIKHEDLDKIIAIEKVSFRLPWSRERFQQEFQANPSDFRVVAVVDEEVVGYSIARIEIAINIRRFKMYRRCHLLKLAVEPEYRRMGIGDSLLRETIRYARRGGANEVILEVRAKNIQARRFYSNRGFSEVKYKEGYYLDDDAVVMTLKLD
jgi:ribosomal-protein-alanine N-acetyltransferase